MSATEFADAMAQVLEPLGFIRLGPELPLDLLEEIAAVFPDAEAIWYEDAARGLFCRASDGVWVSATDDGWTTSEGVKGTTIEQLISFLQ